MRISLPFFFLLLWSVACAQDFEPIRWHVHEAFMINEAPISLLQTVTQPPPHSLQENIPQQTYTDAIWIPGYWDWSQEHNDYIWCSGNWRLPPPGHQWVAGYWQRGEEGWVRVRGFWSQTPEDQLVYITEPPPDVLDEDLSQQPGKDFFFMPGYWMYENNQYQWYSGSWQQVDPSWVYVPPKYIWRTDGFVFVPAFWDWPIEERGTAYACILVPQGLEQITYTTELILEPQTLISDCILFFPDYCYFYFYYGYVHPEWLASCPYCPPWLAWDWWWLPWSDQWGLWWWWCTPGYPAPNWLPPEAIHQFYPPPQQLVIVIRDIRPPVIITPNGVVPPGKIFSALSVKNKPIIPKNPLPIQKKAAEKIKKGKPERPDGPKVPFSDLEKKIKPLPKVGKEAPETGKKGKQPEPPKTKPQVEKPVTKPVETKPPKAQAPETKKPETKKPTLPVAPEKSTRLPEKQVTPPPKPAQPQIGPSQRQPSQPQQMIGPSQRQQLQSSQQFMGPSQRQPSQPQQMIGPSQQKFQQPSMQAPSSQSPMSRQSQMQAPQPSIQQPSSPPPQATSPINPSSPGKGKGEK